MDCNLAAEHSIGVPMMAPARQPNSNEIGLDTAHLRTQDPPRAQARPRLAVLKLRPLTPNGERHIERLLSTIQQQLWKAVPYEQERAGGSSRIFVGVFRDGRKHRHRCQENKWLRLLPCLDATPRGKRVCANGRRHVRGLTSPFQDR